MRKKYLSLVFLWLGILVSLQAQTLEGVFSFQGEETVASTIQLTAIGGQPFEGTAAGSLLAYGFVETVSTANEYTDVTALTLGQHEASLEAGSSLKLSASFSPAEVDNQAVGWFSSDPSVVTVKDGTISALKAGNAVISVVSASGIFSDRCDITVTKSGSDPVPEPDPILVTGVSLEPQEALLKVGETIELEATVSPQNADDKRVEWISSDENVATVQAGVVTAVATGTAVVRVTTVDGGYTATCTVTVSAAPTSIDNVSGGNNVSLVDDYLHLELQKPQIVYIFNVSGKVCDVVQSQSGLNTVSMQKYPAGIYFVRMENKVVKVVKR